MAYRSNEEGLPLLVDMTGRQAQAASVSLQGLSVEARIPFDAVLDLDDPQLVQTKRARPGEAEYKEKFLELKNFGKAVPLLCWNSGVLRALWRSFFQAQQETAQNLVFSGGVVLITPMAWGPPGMDALASGFTDIFGPNKVNVCAKALPALFFGLEQAGYFHGGKGGKMAVVEQQQDAPNTAYYFNITNTSSGLDVLFTGWKSPSEKPGKSKAQTVIWKPGPHRTSLALDGYQEILKHGADPSRPHVSVDMAVSLGVRTSQDTITSLLAPDAPLGQWFQREFLLQEDQELVEAYIHACPEMGFFPVARLLLDEGGPFEKGQKLAVQLVKDNHAQGRGLLEYKHRGRRSLERPFMLPRLFT